MTQNRPNLVHLKSSGYTNSTPTAPVSGDLKKGEIAVNYNNTEPSLFIEKANGEIARFADLTYIDNHYLKTESDPIFTGSPAYNITNADITNWNNMVASGKVEYHAGENIEITDDNIISVTGLPTEFKTINGSGITGSGEVIIDIPDVSNFVTSADVKTQIENYHYVTSGQVDTQIEEAISGLSPYTAGEYIDIDNYVISVTGMPEVSGFVTSAQVETQIEEAIKDIPTNFATINNSAITDGGNLTINEYNGITSGDVTTALGYTPLSAETPYTAGNNIDINGHVISVTGMPVVNDGVLTIQHDGNTLGTFSANTSADVTINFSTTDKADKDTDAVEGNVAVFDASGNPVDGGVSLSNVLLDGGTYTGVTAGEALTALTAITLNGKSDTDFALSSHTHSEYENQNAFGNLTDGSNTYQASSVTDTIAITGEGITTASLDGNKIVVNTPTFPAYNITDADITNWNNMVASGKVEYHAGTNIEITNDNTINVTGVTSYTGINGSEVINALGYTPYDASNPDGYITGYTNTTYEAGTNIAITGDNNTISVTGINIPDVSQFVTSGQVETQIEDAISGIPKEFKTINNSAITGTGNLTINEYSGITGEEVIEALGYTPYNNTNPSGFVTTDTTYEAGNNIAITGTNNTICVTGLPDFNNFLTSSDVKTQIEEYHYVTSGDVKTQVEDYHYLTEHQSLAGLFANAEYVSTAKTIYFYDKTGTTVASIDATAFIKDGMVSNVVVSGDNLVITFNEDAGKETIYIPISQIFDVNNYYTKEETDNRITAATENMATTGWVDSQGYLKEHQSLSAYSTTEQMNTAIENATSGKADSSAVTEAINTAMSVETGRTESTYLKEHQSLTAYSTTEQVNTLIENAVSGKQDTLVSGTNIKTINNESLLGEGNITIEGRIYSAGNNIAITGESNAICVTGINIPDVSEFVTSADVKTQIEGYHYITSADAETQITNKNYITSADVETQITNKNYITSGDAETQIINKNYVTSGDVNTQITNAISGIPKEFKTINNNVITGTGNISISEYCGITSTDVINALGYTPYSDANPSGFVTTDTTYEAGNNIAITGTNNTICVTGVTSYTGINGSEVIAALGYTPYNASNPAGYITADTATTYGGHYQPSTDTDYTNVNGFINALQFDGKGHIISYGTGVISDSATTQDGHYSATTANATAKTSASGTLSEGGSFDIPWISFDDKGHKVEINSISLTLPTASHYVNPLEFKDASNNSIVFDQASSKTITLSALTNNVNVEVDDTNNVIGIGVGAPASAETAGRTVSALTINYKNGDSSIGTATFNGSANTTVDITSLTVSSVTGFTSAMTDPSIIYAVSGASRRGVNWLTGFTAGTLSIPTDKDYVYVKFDSGATTSVALDINSGMNEGDITHVILNASQMTSNIDIALNISDPFMYASSTATLTVYAGRASELDILLMDGIYFICQNEYPQVTQNNGGGE